MTEIKNCTTNFYPEVCGVNVVIDPQTQSSTEDDRVLIIGQKTDDGTATINTPYFASDRNREDLFGAGSMLNRMISEFKEIAPTAEVWAIAVEEVGSQAASILRFSGVPEASRSGVIYLWVNGRNYQVSFDPTEDTNESVVQKFASMIQATEPYLTVTASGDTLEIQTIQSGEVASFLDVRLSYSHRPDLVSSSEVTITKTDTVDSSYPPVPTQLLTSQESFEFIVSPYFNDEWLQFLDSYTCSQWSGGANSRAYGVEYGDVPALTALGQRANNALISIMGIDGALTPSYLESAAYGALVFNQLHSGSASLPESMTGQVMPAMLAPEVSDQFTAQEKSFLVESGIGYFDMNRVKDMMIGSAVTTFTTRDNGVIDYSLREVNKPAMMAFISDFMRERIQARFTGYAVRRDGVVGTARNTKVATLSAIRNFVAALGQELSEMNIIQDVAGFLESLTVTVNEDGCIEVSVAPELVDQFCCLTAIIRTY